MPFGGSAAPVGLCGGLRGCSVGPPLFLHLGGPVVGRRRRERSSRGHRHSRLRLGGRPVLVFKGIPLEVLGLVCDHLGLHHDGLFSRLLFLLGLFGLPVEEQIDDYVPFGLAGDEPTQTENLSIKHHFNKSTTHHGEHKKTKQIRWKNLRSWMIKNCL